MIITFGGSDISTECSEYMRGDTIGIHAIYMSQTFGVGSLHANAINEKQINYLRAGINYWTSL